jgi:hypothetical protein
MSIKPLDLANKADFLTATGSSIAQLGLLFGKKPEEWDIEEASYNEIVFHVFRTKQPWNGALSSIRDSGGRRLVQYKFPYMDGQTTDDLGRESETFELDILLFGERYTSALKNLFRELQKPEAGTLIHPVRGSITCKMLRYELGHSHDARKAVSLKVTFVEHNFSLASYGKNKIYVTFKSRLADLMAVFAFIASVKNTVQGLQNLANAVINEITVLVDSFNLTFTDTVVSMNSVFNRNEKLDIPMAVPVNQGGLVNPDGTFASSKYTSAPNDPFASIPINQIQASIAAQQSLLGTETAQNLAATLGAVLAQQKVNNARAEIENLVAKLSGIKFGASKLDSGESDGAIELATEILGLKRTAILLQDAYNAGMKQAKLAMKLYTTPRVMSAREVAWANGLQPDRMIEIDILNPELESLNLIPANTEVFVPA